MNDAGYIAAGFVITFAVIVVYVLSLWARLRQAQRAHVGYLAHLRRYPR